MSQCGGGRELCEFPHYSEMLVPQRLYPLMLQNHRGEAFRETLCLSRCLHCDCIAAILQPRLVLSSFRWWLMDVSMGTLSWNTTLSETVLLLFTSVMLLCMGSFHRAPDHLWLVKPRGIFAQVGGLTSVSWPNSSYNRMELPIYSYSFNWLSESSLPFLSAAAVLRTLTAFYLRRTKPTCWSNR